MHVTKVKSANCCGHMQKTVERRYTVSVEITSPKLRRPMTPSEPKSSVVSSSAVALVNSAASMFNGTKHNAKQSLFDAQ